MPNRTRVNGNILATQDETGGLHGRDVELYIMVAGRVSIIPTQTGSQSTSY